MMRYITVPTAPPPPKGARYSHAVEAGGFLYVTGQLPVDPADPDADLPAGIEAQTEMTLHNLKLVVEAAGFRLADTVFARIYLKEFERDYARMNAVYARQFGDDERMPGRTTVGVTRLARDALVEIDLVLVRS